ncbi:hypothetical protein [Propionivibrio sp.]|uniref:hypothetical protein n=1 Tax=Propionivibrio sp. TaxID=2212460 RepID=UPI003BF387BC
MTRPVLPPAPEVPDSTVNELHALYHQVAGDEPSLMLDRCILNAARAEVQSHGTTESRPQAPWWKRWLAPASAIAVAALGLSLSWHVMDQQERDMREEMSATQAERKGEDDASGQIAPAAKPDPAQPSSKTQASTTTRRAETKAARNSPAEIQEQAAPPARGLPAELMVAPPAPAAPAFIAPPMPAHEAQKKSKRAEVDEPREKRDTRDAVSAGSGLAHPLGKLEARQPGPDSSASAAADYSSDSTANATAKSADDAATPEAWLKHIRELRAAGRNAAAAQSLARFRLRYPSFMLPDDLINLK